MSSTREADNDYRDIAIAIGPETRIINCKDGLQWIVQTRRGGRWRPDGFWRWRDPMLSRLKARPELTLSREAETAIKALPAKHP
ncbi:hypothetical protein D8676_04995 [Mesorhizobium sp. YM1C-6-2]|nr:hypothetical protein D8676_04995 [Mesorhizobium sp. YM1C-6-2]